jgi:hypothetical protein
MELSGFTIMSKDFKNYKVSNGMTIYFKHMLFAKFDNKVYVEVSNAVAMSVIISFDELMKHEQLKTYYELSLASLGKPNVDPAYYASSDPNYVPKKYEKNYDMYVDTIYIVKNVLENTQEAIKGNTYHTINIDKLKKMNVSTDAKKDEFFKDYQSKYSFEEDGFEETKALYKTLVSGL